MCIKKRRRCKADPDYQSAMSTEPLDRGDSAPTATATFDRWQSRAEGAPGWFSKLRISDDTLSKVVGCKNHHLRAEGRQLTHIEASIPGQTGGIFGITVHAKGHDGEYTSASNQVDHHLSASGDDDACADRYHAVMTSGTSGTIPISLETIPLDKATATAVRWSDVTDPAAVKADISKVDIKKEDGSTQTIATFPVDSAMGRLYKLNANNASFSKGIKLTEFPTDTGSHMAVSDAAHAEERAASLAEALTDSGAFRSLDIHLHAPGYERPGPVNVRLQFRRNNGEAIEPIGTQSQDADGKLTDKGHVKLPDGIHANVLSLVDGPATGIEAAETPGADEE